MKAEISPVLIGNLFIQGLLLEDGSFAVSVPQIARIALDKDSPENAHKALEEICQAHCKSAIHWLPVDAGPGHKEVLCVSLDDFQCVVRAADKAGHKAAANFVDDVIESSISAIAEALERTPSAK